MQTSKIILRRLHIEEHPVSRNKFTTKQFFDEFSSFLEEKVISPTKLCIVGDFNFHLDEKNNTDTINFLQMLESFDLVQHVKDITHNRGHMLDLVISCPSDQLVDDISVKDMQVSDHFWVHGSLLGPKPKTVKKEISFRKIRSINMENFENDVTLSLLAKLDSTDSIEGAVSKYNSELADILNKHAPVITKTVVIHPDTPWFTSEIELAKRERRRAEKAWRKSKLTVHRDIFVKKKEQFNQLVTTAKQSYFKNLIADSSDIERSLLASSS